ncbi:MAG: DsbA family protein [Patescibacteria group bacterium]|nr:DsbA family protein [Patescibacteria group bacterium]
MEQNSLQKWIWPASFVAVIVVLIGLLVLVNNNYQGKTLVDVFLTKPIDSNDHTKGNEKSAVTLVEYSDFQCPACGAYYPLVKKITEQFGDKIYFAYRHFPLSQHQNAKLSSFVSEASGKQGKFFEMHDMIFDNQLAWSESNDAKKIFTEYAMKLGLDMEKFNADIESKEIIQKVDNDAISGVNSGVDSTPSFFLNGKKINNPQSYEEFEKIINDAINNS